jgi:hypothetical protein
MGCRATAAIGAKVGRGDRHRESQRMVFGEGIKTILIYQQPWGSILLFDYNFENGMIGMKFSFIQFIRKDVSNMERGTFKHLDSRVRNVIGCFLQCCGFRPF